MSNEIKDLAHESDPVYGALALRRTRSQSRLGPRESLKQALDASHPLTQLADLVPNLAHIRTQTDNLCPQAADFSRQSCIDVGDLVPNFPDLVPEFPHLKSEFPHPLPELRHPLPELRHLAPQRPYAGHYDRSQGNGGDNDGDEFLAQTFHGFFQSRQRDCSTGDSEQM